MENSYFMHIKDRLIELDYVSNKFEREILTVDDLLKDPKVINSTLFPKISLLNKKRVGTQTMLNFIEKEKREMMRQIRENFKFIGGFSNNMQIRDVKGSLTNKEWRVDDNINKKIIRPTSRLTSCQRSIEDLGRSNQFFTNYIKRLRRINRNGPLQEEEENQERVQSRSPHRNSKEFIKPASPSILDRFKNATKAQMLQQKYQQVQSPQTYSTQQHNTKFIDKQDETFTIKVQNQLDEPNKILKKDILDKLESQSYHRLQKSGQLEKFQNYLECKRQQLSSNDSQFQQSINFEARKKSQSINKNPFGLKQKLVQNIENRSQTPKAKQKARRILRKSANQGNVNQTFSYDQNQSRVSSSQIERLLQSGYNTTYQDFVTQNPIQPIAHYRTKTYKNENSFDVSRAYAPHTDQLNTEISPSPIETLQIQSFQGHQQSLTPAQIVYSNKPNSSSLHQHKISGNSNKYNNQTFNQSIRSDSLSQDSRYQISKDSFDEQVEKDIDKKFALRYFHKSVDLKARVKGKDKGRAIQMERFKKNIRMDSKNRY
eukprot:403340937